MQKKWTPRMLVTLSVLVTIQIILSRFCSFSAWSVKIGFGFVPIVVAAMLYGALPAAAVAALGDLLGSTLFPIGAYFPGFTLCALITGLIYGVCFKSKIDMKRIIIAVILDSIITTLLLNSIWISILYGADFRALLMTRSFQAICTAPVKIIVMEALSVALSRTDLRKVLLNA